MKAIYSISRNRWFSQYVTSAMLVGQKQNPPAFVCYNIVASASRDWLNTIYSHISLPQDLNQQLATFCTLPKKSVNRTFHALLFQLLNDEDVCPSKKPIIVKITAVFIEGNTLKQPFATVNHICVLFLYLFPASLYLNLIH